MTFQGSTLDLPDKDQIAIYSGSANRELVQETAERGGAAAVVLRDGRRV